MYYVMSYQSPSIASHSEAVPPSPGPISESQIVKMEGRILKIKIKQKVRCKNPGQI